jgi:hypothetical protein
MLYAQERARDPVLDQKLMLPKTVNCCKQILFSVKSDETMFATSSEIKQQTRNTLAFSPHAEAGNHM